MMRQASRQMKNNVKTDGFAWWARRYSRSRPIGLLAALVVALVPLQAGGGTKAILVGAGDIAKCGKRLSGTEATAKLLDDVLSAKLRPVGGLFGKTGYCWGGSGGSRGSAKASRGEIVSRIDRTVSSVP